jgi:hypothetical protein
MKKQKLFTLPGLELLLLVAIPIELTRLFDVEYFSYVIKYPVDLNVKRSLNRRNARFIIQPAVGKKDLDAGLLDANGNSV